MCLFGQVILTVFTFPIYSSYLHTCGLPQILFCHFKALCSSVKLQRMIIFEKKPFSVQCKLDDFR